MYQQPHYRPYGHHPPRRSAIPKVIGILMIVFGSLGILGALVGSLMPTDPQLARLDAWREYEKITHLMGYIGVPVSLFQLIAGIACVKYVKTAPALAMVYGALSVAPVLRNGTTGTPGASAPNALRMASYIAVSPGDGGASMSRLSTVIWTRESSMAALSSG